MQKQCKCCRLKKSIPDDFCPECKEVMLLMGNKYQILEGRRGGMATVYKSLQKNLNRLVAIKVLHREFIHDQEIIQQFIDEARIAASLQHPNIVIVHDVGSVESINYIIMEYLDGVTLSDQLYQKKFIPVKDVSPLLSPVAEALDYIHSYDYVHRDVKCSNIIITKKGRPVLTDFGVVFSAKNNHSSSVYGTPEYMSPEQAAGQKNINGRSDLYSLGTVMFECATGRVPIKGGNPMDTVDKIINHPPPELQMLNPKAPDWYNNLTMDLLEKDPSKRPDSGRLVAGYLQQQSYPKPRRKKPSDRTMKMDPPPSMRTGSIKNAGNRKTRILIAALFTILAVMGFAIYQLLVNTFDRTSGSNISAGVSPLPVLKPAASTLGADTTANEDSLLTALQPSPSAEHNSQEQEIPAEEETEPIDPEQIRQQEEAARAREIDRLIDQGNRFLARKNLERALQSYSEVLRLDPERTSIRNQSDKIREFNDLVSQAQTHASSQNYQRAIRTLNDANTLIRDVAEVNRLLDEYKKLAENSVDRARFSSAIQQYNLIEVAGGSMGSFYIGKYEVSQALWQEIMGSNPSLFKGSRLPVENISSRDIANFISKLNQKTGLNFRLPTASEWEWAAKGGSSGNTATYSGGELIEDVGWYEGNAEGKTHTIGSKKSNRLGIYDMSGNVAELCAGNIIKGGSWLSTNTLCYINAGRNVSSNEKDFTIGFRICISKP